jgi:hypothetical protein
MDVAQFLRKAQSERINLVHRESRGRAHELRVAIFATFLCDF